MKKCGQCKEEKDLASFSKDKNMKDGLCWMCKPCKSLTMKNLFKNSIEFRKKTYARKAESVLRLKIIVFEFLLKHPCVDCGNNDPRVMEFDHVSGVKEVIISRAKNLGCPSKLTEEMSKCEVRCGNCHRRKTGKDYPSYKDKAYEKMQNM